MATAPLVVGGLALAAGLMAGEIDDPFVTVMLWLSPLFAFLAAVIATRVPGNGVAWLLLTVGLSIPVTGFASLAIPTEPPAEPTVLLGIALLLVGGSWMAFVFPILLVLFLFPSGSFLTPRWRWAAWLVGVMIAVFCFIAFFSVEWSSETWTVPNPNGFIPTTFFDGPFGLVWSGGLVALAIGGLISIVLRYRRSVLVARTQIKWFVVPAVAFAVFYALSAAIPGDAFVDTTIFSIGFGVTFLSLPVAMTIAITRYRLYEIDRIVSRTVSYLVVVGALTAAYFGLVLLLRSFLPIEGPLPVALSTLAVAFAFFPLARRVQRFVDRRFFRSRYDAAAIVSEFASDLRQTIGTEAVVALTVAVVAGVFAPEAIDVWLDGNAS